jgi:hypothetical protein
MSDPRFLFVTKSPAECSERELIDFKKLVSEGGEVGGATLEEGIRRAKALVFMMHEGKLKGVTGLKVPAASYRSSVATKSGAALPAATISFELGWVYIVPSAQGNHLCRPMVQAAIKCANGAGMFATSRQSKAAMHFVLTTESFVQTGNGYLAADGKEKLLLFVRGQSARVGVTDPAEGLLKELHVAMLGIYQRSLRETGVNHSLFHRMITEQGAQQTALHLVHALKPSDGYTDLYLKGRLDLTVEALVLEAKWHPVFADETRQLARQRLTEYRFDFAKYGL